MLQQRTVVTAAVASLTLLGLAFRIAAFDQSLFADELSTYWIVHDHSLGRALSIVYSNDEITPPLSFILEWLTLKLGGTPEWVRLPSLVAGTATIPLVYLLGARTVGRAAGLIAAAVMALSPFMIYYSTEARAYALMIAFVAASTLALLAAVRTGRNRWWVIYAVCSCAALYSHYTSAFPLLGQALWVLWQQRQAFRACILANLGVLIGFAPWIPAFIADNNSPTTVILSALEPFAFKPVRQALEQWSIGSPSTNRISIVPGNIGLTLIAAGLLVALVAGGWRLWRIMRARSVALGVGLRRIPAGASLVAILALATPVGEALFSAVGTNLLGARNLNASWPGLAVAIGGIVAAAGVPLSFACAAMVLGGYAIGAVKASGPDLSRPQYAEVAKAIEQRWKPGDVVVDGASMAGRYRLSPVTPTALDAYLPQTHPEVRLGFSNTEGPNFRNPAPPLQTQVQEAYRRARGHSLFLMTYVSDPSIFPQAAPVLREQDLPAQRTETLKRYAELIGGRGLVFTGSGLLLAELPPGFHVEPHLQTFSGVVPLALIEITNRGAGR
jgi:4-amino-4-deoxy-L-arabinose transferase-like glycosyltransferase